MSIQLFQKIATNIKFEWSIDDLSSKMLPDVYHGNNIPKFMYDQQDNAYFQTFYSDVSTSTNFWKQFKYESEDIVDKVCLLQQQVKEKCINGEMETTHLIHLLLEKKMSINDALFLRMKCSIGAAPHCDQRRKKALNIGVRNSSTCTTIIKHGTDTDNFFESNELFEFTMQDGDAYLLNVGEAHAVKTKVPDSQDFRYIISVNLSRD